MYWPDRQLSNRRKVSSACISAFCHALGPEKCLGFLVSSLADTLKTPLPLRILFTHAQASRDDKRHPGRTPEADQQAHQRVYHPSQIRER